MTDFPIYGPATKLASQWRLKLWQWVVALLLLSIGCVAVRDLTETDQCKTTLGRLSVALKLDSYFSNCQCMAHSLDFSDVCNGAYIPALL